MRSNVFYDSREGFFAIGNGLVLLTSNRQRIEHVGSCSCNFFGIDILTREVVCEKEYGFGALNLHFRNNMPSSSADELRSEVKMAVYPDPLYSIMIFSLSAMFDLYLEIKLCDNVRMEYFEKYSSELEGRPCRKFIKDGESLYLITDKKIEIGNNNTVIHIPPGCSRMFMAVLPNEDTFEKLRRLMKNTQLSAVNSSRLYDITCRKFGKMKDRHSAECIYPSGLSKPIKKFILYCFETAIGFVESGGGISYDDVWLMSDMCDVFRLFIALKNRSFADKFIELLFSVFNEHGDIPVVYSPNKEKLLFAGKGLSNPAFEKIVRSLYEYEKVFGGCQRESFRDIMTFIVKRSSSIIKSGMMPFSGFEKKSSSEFFCGMQKFQGSARATMEYISLVKHYVRYMKENNFIFEASKLEAITEYMRKTFPENFMRGLSFNLNSPKRMQYTRYPKRISGVCDCCGRNSVLWLLNDRYCCKTCSISESLDDCSAEVKPMENGIIAEGYFETDIIYGNPVFEMIDPVTLDIDGLIMCIKYYSQREDAQERFFCELVNRFDKNPDGFSFPMLCRIASDLIFYGGDKLKKYRCDI